jgi:hypothetical protein
VNPLTVSTSSEALLLELAGGLAGVEPLLGRSGLDTERIEELLPGVVENRATGGLSQHCSDQRRARASAPEEPMPFAGNAGSVNP